MNRWHIWGTKDYGFEYKFQKDLLHLHYSSVMWCAQIFCVVLLCLVQHSQSVSSVFFSYHTPSLHATNPSFHIYNEWMRIPKGEHTLDSMCVPFFLYVCVTLYIYIYLVGRHFFVNHIFEKFLLILKFWHLSEKVF